MSNVTLPVTNEEWVNFFRANPDLYMQAIPKAMLAAKNRLEVLEMVRETAEALLEFIEAWDTIDPTYRDNLRRALNLAKAVPG